MKRVFISGASGGIGFATAKKFLENGYFVIAQYNLNVNKINELSSYAKEIGKEENLFAIKIDLSSPCDITEKLNSLKKSFKKIDVIVNNAGIGLYKLITETTIEEWEKLFNVNLTSAYLINNAFINQMINAKNGKIINVSSMWGLSGASMEVCYSASKSAIIGYTKALAKELAPSGITVNCVCPGVIDTAMNARFNNEEIEELKEQTPLGRLGKPEEVAELIYFLSGEQSNFITGQCISIDGGFIL